MDNLHRWHCTAMANGYGGGGEPTYHGTKLARSARAPGPRHFTRMIPSSHTGMNSHLTALHRTSANPNHKPHMSPWPGRSARPTRSGPVRMANQTDSGQQRDRGRCRCRSCRRREGPSFPATVASIFIGPAIAHIARQASDDMSEPSSMPCMHSSLNLQSQR